MAEKEYVRVRDSGTGHEYTTTTDRVVEGLKVIDKPALGPDGLPASPKYRLPLGKSRRHNSATKTSAANEPTDNNGQSAESEKEN